MALALANAATVKPEIALEQALLDYETVLTDEEKVNFRAQGSPNANEAIRLTTIIDEKRRDGRLRCMGPRLITFLESVQQFSKVVETMVSSRPEIAALVWGGVKMTLLIANNVSSYFDRLSALLMDLGRQCPRYREFELLYPSSRRLQKALCDYYAGVVRLCRHSTKLYKTSTYTWLPKAVWSPFDSEFGPFKTNLQRLSEEVQQEIVLAAARSHEQEFGLQEQERRATSRGRKMLNEISRKVHGSDEAADRRAWELTHRRMANSRQKALDALSVYDHMKTYKQLRKDCVPGTSTWLCDTSDFQDWLKGPGKTLWCTGKLGSGKSIISACVTAYLSSNALSRDVVSFFFCRYDHGESLKARIIVGTIARQLVERLPAKAFEAFSLASSDVEAIVQYLSTALSEKQRYVIILDGLDECKETQIRETAQALQDLLDMPRLCIKIYFSSRPYVVKWLPLGLRPEAHIALESPENQEKVAFDVGTVIETTLMEQLEGESPELNLGDPALVLTIQHTLQQRAQGMFLWVKFQLSDLCDQRSDSQILAALEDLPADLPQTFGRLLRKYEKSHDINLGSQIFRWIAVAKRPLTLAELREAIAVEPFQEDWKGQNMVNDMKTEIACCGNLIFVDEEDDTIQFTHFSVKQYLCSDMFENSLQPYHIAPEKAEAEIAIVCATLAVKLLKRTDRSRQAVPLLVDGSSPASNSQSSRTPAERFAFRQYANDYWLLHSKHCREGTSDLKRFWRNLIGEAKWLNTLSSVPWTAEDWSDGNTIVVGWIIEEDHYPLASLLFEGLQMSHSHANQILEGAGRSGFSPLVDLVLSSWLAESSSNFAIQSAFNIASEFGNVEVIERLGVYMRRKKQKNNSIYRFEGGTSSFEGDLEVKLEPALVAAAQGGHVATVDALLKAGFWNENFGNVGRAPRGILKTRPSKAIAGAPRAPLALQLALVKAASFGHLAVVERLLREGLDTDALVASLSEASSKGHLSVVDRLLSDRLLREMGENHRIQHTLPLFGPDVSPLVRAAIGGHAKVVRRLLEVEKDPNHRVWANALQRATSEDHSFVVYELLEKIPQFDSPLSKARHLGEALRSAASMGHLAVVERLLSSGADVDFADESKVWETALYFATVSGCLAIVECLLRCGANVSVVGFKRGAEASALQRAYESGHKTVVERLRAKSCWCAVAKMVP